MNQPSQRPPAVLQTAMQRIKTAFRDSVDRVLDDLVNPAITAATKVGSREDIAAAQFELNRKQSALAMRFNEIIDEGLASELRRRQAGGGRTSGQPITGWQSLTLVDDEQIEQQVSAERVGQVIRGGCENEVQELDKYVGALLPAGERPEGDRNPLRPDVVGKGVVVSVDSIAERAEVRRVLVAHMERVLRGSLGGTYAAIVEDFRRAGIQPLGMSVRHVQGPGTEFGSTGYDTSSRAHGMGGDSKSGALGDGGSSGSNGGREGLRGNGTVMGQVDHEVMALIRRLAAIGNVATDSQLDTALATRVSGPGGLGPVQLPNLIARHRDELRGATSSTLDHMVIDVVASVFDQILSDPKVPPQMARHIARLQLPVLRAALGDRTFFSSRKHPVRRFVNRIASLAVAFDDFTEGTAREFLELVRELVDEIVAGDFDQMEPYEEKLDRLEAFIAEQAQREVAVDGSPGAVLNQRELDLLQHQRYMQQMQTALAPVPMEDFLRQFLSQVWSQAIVHAHRVHGPDADMTRRMRSAGRELVLSVQPKGTPADRKHFLMRLPQLMKDLNEGLAMIGWPEEAKKAFLARLLPAHSESLKQQSMRVLDFNLLGKQLDAVMATPIPRPGEGPAPGAVPVVDDVIAPGFTPEEARRIGLVQEQQVDWDGSVDIDLSAEPAVAEVDIEIPGLDVPTAEPETPDANEGVALAENLQIGFSYRMHFEKAWHKVRLSHISPGRTFFVFTRGTNHSEAISMTARMLYRMCESGRLRPFENAYLIERATARARKQLAEIRTGMGASPSLM